MLTPVQKARLASRAAIKKLDPRSITITRDGDESSATVATIGETRTEDYRDDNVLIVVRFRDYLIDVGDYRIDVGGIESVAIPVAGDFIKETIIGTVRYFEVLADGGSDEYRAHDRDGNTWRVHTKERKAPPA